MHSRSALRSARSLLFGSIVYCKHSHVEALEHHFAWNHFMCSTRFFEVGQNQL